MIEVPCSYCQYYRNETEESNDDKNLFCSYGKCELKNIRVDTFGKVCEDFILASGIYTKKSIPEYCKFQEYEQNKYGIAHRKTDI